MAKHSGANIVINYWNTVWSHYGNPQPKPYSRDEYLLALREYLDAVQGNGMKAIVDLGVGEKGENGFSNAGIASLVLGAATHPAVFAWYLYDEPYLTLFYLNCGTFPTRDHLQAIADTVRAVERRRLGSPRHPLLPVITDPRFFADYNHGGKEVCASGMSIEIPPPFYPSSYDAIGWDSYVYRRSNDEVKNWWTDYNTLIRLATRRGVAQTKKLGKMAFIAVVQGADSSSGTDLRRPTAREIAYESLAPLIHGARGLLYFWWNPAESSPQTRTSVNRFISFLRTHELDRILMQGAVRNASGAIAGLSVEGKHTAPDNYTWRLHNNLGRPVEENVQDPGETNFRQFTAIARKYKGKYYLFAVNDFRRRVDVLVALDAVTAPRERVTSVEELAVDGTITTKRVTRDGGMATARVSDTFDGYTARVYRISVAQ
jgi:hypothetical protein